MSYFGNDVERCKVTSQYKQQSECRLHIRYKEMRQMGYYRWPKEVVGHLQ